MTNRTYAVLVGLGLNLVVAGATHAAPVVYSETPILYNLVDSGAGQTPATVADFQAAGIPAGQLTAVSDSQVLTNQNSAANGINVFGGTFNYDGGGNNAPPTTSPIYQYTRIANPQSTETIFVTGLSTSSQYHLLPNSAYTLYVFPVNVIVGPDGNDSITYNGVTTNYINHPSEVPIAYSLVTGSTVSDTLQFTFGPASDEPVGTTDNPAPREYHGYSSFAIVPEPASLTMLGLGAIPLLARRRRA